MVRSCNGCVHLVADDFDYQTVAAMTRIRLVAEVLIDDKNLQRRDFAHRLRNRVAFSKEKSFLTVGRYGSCIEQGTL